MVSETRELIYWDSVVFIDWLKGPKASSERIQPIRSVIDYVEQGTHKLVVSTVLYVEVLTSHMSGDAKQKFQDFMKNRRKVEIIAVDVPIAKKAQEIRNNTRLETPDAIHAATAIISRARLLHTFDNDLLQLSKRSEIDNLVITECIIPGVTSSIFD